MVLLNDVDDSCILYLFFVHVCATMDLQGSANFIQRWNKRPRAAFIRKKKMKKDAQMPEHNSYNEGIVMRVEGIKQTKVSDQLTAEDGEWWHRNSRQVSLELFSQSTVSPNLATLNCSLSQKRLPTSLTLIYLLSHRNCLLHYWFEFPVLVSCWNHQLHQIPSHLWCKGFVRQFHQHTVSCIK